MPVSSLARDENADPYSQTMVWLVYPSNDQSSWGLRVPDWEIDIPDSCLTPQKKCWFHKTDSQLTWNGGCSGSCYFVKNTNLKEKPPGLWLSETDSTMRLGWDGSLICLVTVGKPFGPCTRHWIPFWQEDIWKHASNRIQVLIRVSNIKPYSWCQNVLIHDGHSNGKATPSGTKLDGLSISDWGGFSICTLGQVSAWCLLCQIHLKSGVDHNLQ